MGSPLRPSRRAGPGPAQAWSGATWEARNPSLRDRPNPPSLGRCARRPKGGHWIRDLNRGSNGGTSRLRRQNPRGRSRRPCPCWGPDGDGPGGRGSRPDLRVRWLPPLGRRVRRPRGGSRPPISDLCPTRGGMTAKCRLSGRIHLRCNQGSISGWGPYRRTRAGRESRRNLRGRWIQQATESEMSSLGRRPRVPWRPRLPWRMLGRPRRATTPQPMPFRFRGSSRN